MIYFRFQKNSWCFLVLLSLSCTDQEPETRSSPEIQMDESGKPEPETETKQSAATPVEIQSLTKRTYREYGTYVGQIEPKKEVKLISYTGGRVGRVFKKRGDTVKKGQKLCDIEGDRLEANLQTQLLNEKLAQETLERSKRHLAQGTASRTQVDRAQLEYLKAKQARIEARKLRDGAFCVSPMDGVIVDRLIEQFDETTANQPTFYIADMSLVKVTIGIPENEIEGYRSGGEAILVRSNSSENIEGKIASVAARVDNAKRTFQMDVEFKNKENQLLSGVTARVKALRYNLEDQIVIPTDSILVLADETAVMVEKDGIAKRKNVVIKSSNETESLVLSGLVAGENLIVSGQTQAAHDTPVQVKNPIN